MGLKKYMTIDIAFLTVIMCVLEVICVVAVKRYQQLWSLSMVTVISLIMIMRWNGFGGISAVVGGIVFVLAVHNFSTPIDNLLSALLTYGLGNIAVLTVLLLKKFIGEQKIKQNMGFLVLYVTVGFLSVVIGRSIVGACFGNNLIKVMGSQLETEVLNYVFGIIVIFIANKQANFFTGQKEYYLSIHGQEDDRR